MYRLLALVLIVVCNSSFGANPAWLAAGGAHTCVAFGATEVYCWGRNDSGQLGNGSKNSSAYPVRVRDAAGSSFIGAKALSAGVQHTCAQTNPDDSIVCWGANSNGQLGDYTFDASALPRQVVDTDGNPLESTRPPSANGNTSCAVTQRSSSETHVACWGANGHGQLGNNMYHDSPAAYVLALPDNVQSVAAGLDHTCYLSNGNNVYCWGGNLLGEIGNGSTSISDFPVPPSTYSIGSIAALASGTDFSCAISPAGDGYCWGDNSHMQMNELFPTYQYDEHPHKIGNLSTSVAAVGIVAGASHACALKADGTAQCWGRGREGQLGFNRRGDFFSPDTVLDADGVSAFSDIVSLAAGGSHTCAENHDGSVWCWGDNSFGQFGDGTHASTALPVRVNFDGIFRGDFE